MLPVPDADFDLDEGEDAGGADVARVSAAVHEVRGGAPFSVMEAAVDVDALLPVLAAERWIGNADGYGSYGNNYRVYFPPGRPARIAPWDMGSTFPADGRNDALWEAPAGILAAVCVADAGCASREAAARAALEVALAGASLGEDLRTLAARIGFAAENDPIGTCDAEAVREAQAGVLAWFD